MPDAGPVILGLLQLLACAVPAVGLAAMLRAARCPGGLMGSAIAAGIVAGLLLGPGVFGRVKTSWHDSLLRGGVEQAAALQAESDRQRIERAALEASGVTDVALEEFDRERLAPRRAEFQAALDRARAEFRSDFGLVQAFVASALLMLALPAACARSGRLWRRTGECAIDTRWRGAGRGALALVLAMTIPFALAMWLLKDLKLALGVAAALAVPAVVALPCGLFIATASGAALGACIAMVGLWTVPATVVGVAAFVALALCVGSESPRRREKAKRSGGAGGAGGWGGWGGAVVVGNVLVPTLTAMLIVGIDPHSVVSSGVFIWMTILALLWSSDGRWLAWRLAGFTWTRAAMPVGAGASMVQLVIAAGCGWAGAPQGVVGALVLGALTIELTAGIRTLLARQMDGPLEEPSD